MHEPISINSNESVQVAAERMADANLPVISVMEGNRVVGLLSNRDLVIKVVAKSLSSQSTKVSEVMNANPARISDDRSFVNALLVMRAKGIHELLVQDENDDMVGIFFDCTVIDTEIINKNIH